MKKLIILLLLIGSVSAQEVQPAPCIGIDCPGNLESPFDNQDFVSTPAPDFINEITCPKEHFKLGEMCFPFKFNSHVEAEQHWYHCALGIGIWGNMIKEKEPEFQPYNVSSVITPLVPFSICNGFMIYPDSNLCSNFPDQKTAELNYAACKETNFQYWIKLQEVLSLKPESKPSHCKDFGNGNVWKPVREDGGGATLVLQQKYCFEDRDIELDMRPLNIYLNDINGNRIDNGRFRHCNRHNEDRLHMNFGFHSGAGVVEILFEDDTTECFFIPDMSKRYD